MPSIRKHGAYMTSPTIDRIIADPDYGIQLLKELKNERQARLAAEEARINAENQVAVLQPKATYHDYVLTSKDAVPITVIAKDYGMSGKVMNEKLHDLGIQYKVKDTWVLYAKYANHDYTDTYTHAYKDKDGETHTRIQTNWTQTGRLFIYKKLKDVGVLPMMERQ